MSDYCLVLPKGNDIRGARNYLGWNQMKLAYKCGCNITTITDIEKYKRKPTKELLERIAKVYAEENIKFHATGGFKVEKDFFRVFEGREGYVKVLEDVLKSCNPKTDEVLYLGSSDKRSNDYVNKKHNELYKAGLKFKLLISETDDFIQGPLEEYRKINPDFFLSKDSIILYKNKIMFVSQSNFQNGDYVKTHRMVLIEDAGIYEQFTKYFYRLWEKAEKVTKSCTEQIFFYPEDKK